MAVIAGRTSSSAAEAGGWVVNVGSRTGVGDEESKRNRMTCRVAWTCLLLALLSACAFEGDAPTEEEPERRDVPRGAAVPAAEEESWRTALLAERARKDEEFASSGTSPMAGTQYLKSEARELVILLQEGRTFGLAYETSPGQLLSGHRRGDRWHLRQLRDDVVCRRDGELVESGARIDSRVVCEVNDLRVAVYPGHDRVTFIAFDRERDEFREFDGLRYFPPAVELALRAELEPLERPEKIEIGTSRGLEKTLFRYAKVRFVVDGTERELVALKYALDGEDSGILFIPFRDATSGKETYGAGRYLELEEPAGKELLLDFNRAFNPLCNYSPAYNCALPPPENRLDVPIRAGEMTYSH